MLESGKDSRDISQELGNVSEESEKEVIKREIRKKTNLTIEDESFEDPSDPWVLSGDELKKALKLIFKN